MRVGEFVDIVLLLAWAPICLVSPAALAGDAGKVKTVVVLYADANDGRPGHLLADRGIRATFAAADLKSVQVHSEHLDVSRFPDPAYQQELAEFLRRKYADRKVDVVIVALASGLDFALEYRKHAFPGVPVVFCAVDHREVSARRLPADVIGVPITFDLDATLELALQLHPGTERVYIVTGKSKFDVEWQNESRRVFRAYEDKLEFVHLAGLSMADLTKQVAELPANSIVYYVHVFQDGDGEILVPAEALKLIAEDAAAPIYSHVDTYVGRGIVGGRVFSFEAAGKDAAALARRILAGEEPETIGVQNNAENVYLFDARELQRWGISTADLPPGSEVRFQEPSFWRIYRWHILGIISLCVVETLLIIGLLVQRASRQRAEKRFQQAIDAAPNGMLMIGRDGNIVLVNAQMERLFGYRKDEMLGQPVEMLLPERYRSEYQERRNRFLAAPQARPLAAGRELHGRRKDGSEIAVEIGLSSVRTDLGLFILVSIMDITERRRAEDGLRHSQNELRELTGKLLLAQETERRRIARELHDDLSQSLAFLSVELDMLAQKPPAPGEVAGRFHNLSAMVKQLSSTVHELSHQLHPAKLEQLGLIAAVRSLCNELARNHGLPIGFEHQDVPDAIAADAALCLYRIAQESLQNVVKHSGARSATVELIGEGESICLRVSDDGKGFDRELNNQPEGLGLISMRERLRLVQGEIAIDSRPAAGTRVNVRVPGQPDKERAADSSGGRASQSKD